MQPAVQTCELTGLHRGINRPMCFARWTLPLCRRGAIEGLSGQTDTATCLHQAREKWINVFLVNLAWISIRRHCCMSWMEKQIRRWRQANGWSTYNSQSIIDCQLHVYPATHIPFHGFLLAGDTSNGVVRSRTNQPLLSDAIGRWRLSFFGHLYRTDTSQDHSRALPEDRRRVIGKPRQTWLRKSNTYCTWGASLILPRISAYSSYF